ncbi:MAG: ribonuclease Y [Candidatus Andersenbacteria bacterium]|nr:ribonuclease Y [bacterium]MDZ4225527.1 ribonuclease Y [Candidatus Andersenbacteria bacterium]
MSVVFIILAAVAAAVLGAVGGYAFRRQYGARQAQSLEQKIEHKLKAAKEKLTELRQQAEKETAKFRADSEQELDRRRKQIIELEQRVADREEQLSAKLEQIEKEDREIKEHTQNLKTKEEKLDSLRAEEEKKMAEISGLTSDQAAARVMELAEQRTKEEIVRRVRKMEQEGEKQLEEKAKGILATIIQRYASSHVAETSTSHVTVNDESMIGRVIGKEGRNIQHLERLTGCEIIIDEAPNSITISCFSPIRRQVAKNALEQLLRDGRIHPGRIEEVVEEAKKHINEDIREAGEAVVYDLGIIDFPEKLVQLLGRLKYRTSYRQNMLKHSWEAAHIATMLAEELGADPMIAKKATLLHDIGKAIDHDVEGTHVEIGEKVMRKFGIDEKIIRAASAHHGDYPFDTAEAIIVQVADAVSAARPGARRESLEQYVKRMEDLENIATAQPGVEKAYAIHAGREIRVFVTPTEIDDLAAIKMAQEIARQIEAEMTYPGDIKVNVIRETRAEAKAR